MMPFPYKQKLITCLATTVWCKYVTGLLGRLQVKIENIYLFKILIKNVFKSWLCPNFLLLPKNYELPKIWGGGGGGGGGGGAPPPPPPPRPPGPYAYDSKLMSLWLIFFVLGYEGSFVKCQVLSR